MYATALRPFAACGLLAIVLGCSGAGSPSPVPPAGTPSSVSPPPAATPAAPAATPEAPAAPAAASSARPLYYDRALTRADLDGRSLRELSLMRNTIFARAGNPFVKPWLDQHFRAQPWYKPAAKLDLSVLTDIDRANVTTISNHENSFSRVQLSQMRDEVNARDPSGADPDTVIELGLLSEALGEWVGASTVPIDARNPLEDPNVLDQQLTLARIDEMSRRDLRLLRNTIYARHGRPFTSAVLQGYFADKAWYAEHADYSDALLSDIDKRNIALVQSVEDRLGGPLTEWDHEREEGWFAGA